MSALELRRALVLACTLVLCACIDLRTTIPAVDGAPPEVELQIKGPGIGSQSLSNPPRETWSAAGGGQFLDLVPGATYHFALFVRDPGGVARATISLPTELELSHLVGDGLIDEVVGLRRRLTLTGSRSTPYRLLAISGRLHVPTSGALSFDIGCESSDFGGSSGPPNQRFLYVTTAYGL